jgi:hypothetical protein
VPEGWKDVIRIYKRAGWTNKAAAANRLHQQELSTTRSSR